MIDSESRLAPRRDGRVAEGARLESVYTARYPGFESLSLRQFRNRLPRLFSGEMRSTGAAEGT